MSSDAEWRNFSLTPVELAVYDELRKGLNRVRNFLGTQGHVQPSPTAIAETIAALLLVDEQLMPKPHQMDDVDGGLARCWFPVEGPARFTFAVPDTGMAVRACGSYARLEKHHIRPRSHQGHDGPLAWLCGPHHAAVTKGLDGKGWRWLAEQLGYVDIAVAD